MPPKGKKTGSRKPSGSGQTTSGGRAAASNKENSELHAPSVKINIPPARVQPSRVNKGNRMAAIMASIEEDDDSAVPRRRLRKRQVIESDPEDMFNVPKEIERNPMAPMAKKRKQHHENPSHGSHPPLLLSLQPALPVQVPPPGFQNPERPVSKPRPGPQSQPPAPAPQPLQSQHKTGPDRSDPFEEPEFLDQDVDMQDEDAGRFSPVRSNFEDQRSSSPQVNDHDDIYESPLKSVDLRPEDIDEASPSEDEAAAQRGLRAGGQSGNERDVLDDHRTRNRANKPPNEEQLIEAAQLQLQGPHAHNAEVSENGDGGDDGDDGDDEDEEPLRSRRHKPTQPDPRTAAFYSKCWKEAIHRAKEQFRRFVTMYNLFPSRDEDLQDATRLLAKIVADERSKGKVFSQDFDQTRDMNIVVFKEAATFRRRLKDLCDKVFLRYYGAELGVDDNIESQVDYHRNISYNAEELIGKSSLWHFGPKDAHGKRRNLEHPAIAALCIDFYYGPASGKIPLAKLFPDDFRTSIPEHAVAAVITCLYSCINEYRSGEHIPSEFSAVNYRCRYEGVLKIISLVNGSPPHKQQWEQARRGWAARGMRLLDRKKAGDVCEFTVDLSL